jgi:ubiquinone/menaquinone biosynthesis C-methylase UbiE
MTNRHSRKNIDYYNEQAEIFDESHLFKRENRNHYKKIEKIFELLQLKSGDRVLEIGAGTGIHAKWLTRKLDLHFTGIDVSRGMIDQAFERLGDVKRIEFIVCNAEYLPFKDNSFDAVYCSGSLHHTSNPEMTVEEMTRVVKPDRRLVLMEPNRSFPKNLFHALTNPIERNVLMMTLKNFKNWAKKNRLRNIITSYFIYTPPIPRSLIPLYDRIDNFMEKIPLFKRSSIMLYLCAKK